MAKKQGPCNVNKVYTKYLPGERYGRLVILEEIPKEERKNAYYREAICFSVFLYRKVFENAVSFLLFYRGYIIIN